MDLNSDNLNNIESEIETIGNEKLLNDFIEIELTDGLEGNINNSLDTSKIKVNLGKKLILGISDNSILGNKIQDGSISNSKLETVTNASAAATSNGIIIQQIRTSTAAYTVHTTTIPYDNTIPQNSEGTELLTLTITPQNSDNILVFTGGYLAGCNTILIVTSAIFQDSIADALYAKGADIVTGRPSDVSFQYYMPAGTTSSTTFKLRIGPDSNTLYINGLAAVRKFGGVALATFIVTEYSA